MEISSRPVLTDRIMVNITPNIKEDLLYENEKGELSLRNKSNQAITDLLIENRKIKNLGFKVFEDRYKNKHQDVIIKTKWDYVSNIRIDCYAPFRISLTFNFIRYLRHIIFNDDRYKQYFDFEYDKKIMLDDDNFINYENWKNWDYGLVGNLEKDLKQHFIEIAQEVLFELCPVVDLNYENVTVNEIEFNRDYYCGKNRAKEVIWLLGKFIHTADGERYQRKIESIALDHKAPPIVRKEGLSHPKKNAGESLQFKIAEGLYFKFYHKDRDHIRAEITAKKGFLKRKFKIKRVYSFDKKLKTIDSSRQLDKIHKAMEKFTKDIFKKADVEGLIKKIHDDNSRLLDYHITDKIFDFLDRYDPELLDVLTSAINGFVVSDERSKLRIKKDPNLKILHYRVYDGNGNYVYNYDPVKSLEQKNEMIRKRFAKPYPVKFVDRYEQFKIEHRKQKDLKKSLIYQKRKLARTIKEVDKYGIPNAYSFFTKN